MVAKGMTSEERLGGVPRLKASLKSLHRCREADTAILYHVYLTTPWTLFQLIFKWKYPFRLEKETPPITLREYSSN